MYDGTILGEYVSLEENERIVYKWKFKDWNEFADLVITFENYDDSCKITLDYTNIPEYDSFSNYVHLNKIEEGWR